MTEAEPRRSLMGSVPVARQWRLGVMVILAVAAFVANGSSSAAAHGSSHGHGGGASSLRVAVQQVDLSREEAVALVERARNDEAALDRLLDVTSIEGRPVDLQAVLAEPTGRTARLDALADILTDGADRVDRTAETAEARQQARDVLQDDKYREADVPKPFQGVLQWLADRLRPVGRFLERIFDPVLDLPGGAFILGAALVAGTAAAAVWLTGRRSRAVLRSGRSGGVLVEAGADPADLEARSERCEAAGDLTGAVRLRYQGGLLRLVRADRVTLRPDTTAADVAGQVAEPVLDELTAAFEEIVYGDRPATPADVQRSRHGWRALTAIGTRR